MKRPPAVMDEKKSCENCYPVESNPQIQYTLNKSSRTILPILRNTISKFIRMHRDQGQSKQF